MTACEIFVCSGCGANDALHVLKPTGAHDQPAKPGRSAVVVPVMCWGRAERRAGALLRRAGRRAQPAGCCSILSGLLRCVCVMFKWFSAFSGMPGQAARRLPADGLREVHCVPRKPLRGWEVPHQANRSRSLLTIALELSHLCIYCRALEST